MGRACKAAPGGPQYAVEAGYQALLQGDVQGALAQYSRASHLHELDMEAMYGSIECDLLVGKVCLVDLIASQDDRPLVMLFHACLVSYSGCPLSSYMLQSKNSKFLCTSLLGQPSCSQAHCLPTQHLDMFHQNMGCWQPQQ